MIPTPSRAPQGCPAPRCRVGRSAFTLALVLTLGACGEDDVPSGIIGDRLPIGLELVADGFESPVFVTAAPGYPERLFVVEQGGLIRVIRNGEVLPEPFLDLTSRVSTGGERGLLGMAFHPAYPGNGWVFVNYTDVDGNTRIVRYTVSGDTPDVADPESRTEVLFVDQPFSNHNGGMLAFGRNDGMLYIGLGDGGDAGDPDDNGQDPGTLLGSMLRIDVNLAGEGYFVPTSNPFFDDPDARDEVWAYGLRNPWRFSFDPATGDLYMGDVGQNEWEEISVQPGGSPGGENYGWSVMEGTHCFDPSTGCNTTGLVLPVHEYGHDEGCSVTGGYVYRGAAIPELQGRYLFADYCSGWIRSFLLAGGEATDVQDHSDELSVDGSVASFGRDEAGELYVVVHEGEVYRIVPD
ncbi:MAG: PQQ-dependent sugar dehydrogenase [Gemmatimonadota bacterium]|nr:PQQ-dependent sugar dehydrogenase [Gemmatimonadota bacterium]